MRLRFADNTPTRDHSVYRAPSAWMRGRHVACPTWWVAQLQNVNIYDSRTRTHTYVQRPCDRQPFSILMTLVNVAAFPSNICSERSLWCLSTLNKGWKFVCLLVASRMPEDTKNKCDSNRGPGCFALHLIDVYGFRTCPALYLFSVYRGVCDRVGFYLPLLFFRQVQPHTYVKAFLMML